LIFGEQVADILLGWGSSLGHIRRLLFLQELFNKLEVIGFELLRQGGDVIESFLPVLEFGFWSWSSGVLDLVSVAVDIELIIFGLLVVFESFGENVEPFFELFLVLALLLLLGHSIESILVEHTDVQIVAKRFHRLIKVNLELVSLLQELFDLVGRTLLPDALWGGADHSVVDVVHERLEAMFSQPDRRVLAIDLQVQD
jgi:hypothetical protein